MGNNNSSLDSSVHSATVNRQEMNPNTANAFKSMSDGNEGISYEQFKVRLSQLAIFYPNMRQ